MMTGKRFFKYAVWTTPYDGGCRKQKRARFKPLGNSIAFLRLFPQVDQGAGVRFCQAVAAWRNAGLRLRPGAGGAGLRRSVRLRYKNSRPVFSETEAPSSVTVIQPVSRFGRPHSFKCALGRGYIMAAG